MRKIIMWTWPSLYDSNNTFSRDQSFFIKQHTPQSWLYERMYGLFMMLVSSKQWWQKQSNTLTICHFYLFIYQMGTLYFFISDTMNKTLINTSECAGKTQQISKGIWILIYEKRLCCKGGYGFPALENNSWLYDLIWIHKMFLYYQ